MVKLVWGDETNNEIFNIFISPTTVLKSEKDMPATDTAAVEAKVLTTSKSK